MASIYDDYVPAKHLSMFHSNSVVVNRGRFSSTWVEQVVLRGDHFVPTFIYRRSTEHFPRTLIRVRALGFRTKSFASSCLVETALIREHRLC